MAFSESNVYKVTQETSLFPWLLDHLKPMPRTRVKQLLKHGRVSVNGATTTRHDYALRPGDRVEIARVAIRQDRSLEDAHIGIVLEDEALIVMDKPAGLLTVATASERLETAFARLNAHLTAREKGRPFVVHRLDRETSGLLLFARNATVRDRLQAKWGEVKKTYLAVVEGTPAEPAGVVENFLTEGRDLRVRAIKGKTARRAVTRYRMIGTGGGFSLLEIELETGRKHQIRVHMADLGCPVIGDAVYGFRNDPAGRLGLHAHRLQFPHPVTGAPLDIESPLPAVLRRIVKGLRSR